MNETNALPTHKESDFMNTMKTTFYFNIQGRRINFTLKLSNLNISIY